MVSIVAPVTFVRIGDRRTTSSLGLGLYRAGDSSPDPNWLNSTVSPTKGPDPETSFRCLLSPACHPPGMVLGAYLATATTEAGWSSPESGRPSMPQQAAHGLTLKRSTCLMRSTGLKTRRTRQQHLAVTTLGYWVHRSRGFDRPSATAGVAGHWDSSRVSRAPVTR